jgi:hypothetical protein
MGSPRPSSFWRAPAALAEKNVDIRDGLKGFRNGLAIQAKRLHRLLARAQLVAPTSGG